MDWKEFLKPDLRKIAITILFFLLVPLPNLTYMSLPKTSNECFRTFENGTRVFSRCPVGHPMMYWALNLLHFVLVSPQRSASFLSRNPLTVVLLLVGPYLLSCLLVWVYEKAKKPRKKTAPVPAKYDYRNMYLCHV